MNEYEDGVDLSLGASESRRGAHTLSHTHTHTAAAATTTKIGQDKTAAV